MVPRSKIRLTKKFFCEWFGESKGSANIIFATTPYQSKEECLKDKGLLTQYNNGGNPQTKFMMIHAAKVERTSKKILSFKVDPEIAESNRLHVERMINDPEYKKMMYERAYMKLLPEN